MEVLSFTFIIHALWVPMQVLESSIDLDLCVSRASPPLLPIQAHHLRYEGSLNLWCCSSRSMHLALGSPNKACKCILFILQAKNRISNNSQRQDSIIIREQCTWRGLGYNVPLASQQCGNRKGGSTLEPIGRFGSHGLAGLAPMGNNILRFQDSH
jgi:hypothetical protein